MLGYPLVSRRSPFIDAPFFGSIIVPGRNLSIGQSYKIFWGQAYARNLEVHQDTRFYSVLNPHWLGEWQDYLRAQAKVSQ